MDTCVYVMWMFVSLNQSSQNVFELLEINKLEVSALLLLFLYVCVKDPLQEKHQNVLEKNNTPFWLKTLTLYESF